MADFPDPPPTFRAFTERYPELGSAWEMIGRSGRDGPIDDETARLVKLGVAIAAGSEGATHASVRKAAAMGISPQAIEQVVALAAGTIGLPATVAAFAWVRDVLDD